MAYTPTTWNTGDDVTATKLNKIENGIAGSALIVTSSFTNGAETMDKTVQEIYDAFISGTPVYYKYIYGNPATDYVATMWLAPITAIYTYSSANMIRIAINRPVYRYTTISNIDNAMSPSVMTFQASGMNSYPIFYSVERAAVANSERNNNLNLSVS